MKTQIAQNPLPAVAAARVAFAEISAAGVPAALAPRRTAGVDRAQLAAVAGRRASIVEGTAVAPAAVGSATCLDRHAFLTEVRSGRLLPISNDR